jgi:3-oxoacyl-[acyl-carrier-protein] synthase-3
VLFGDAAGAVLLEPGEDGLLDFYHEVDGAGACHLRMPAGGSARPASHETVEQRLHYVKQDGQHVFKYAVRRFADASRHLLDRNGIDPGQLDCFIAHQANIRIIEAAQHRLGLPDAKVVKNIHKYGNTTAATIPLAMQTALEEGKLRAGSLALLASVGAGFTVGTALVRWVDGNWR